MVFIPGGTACCAGLSSTVIFETFDWSLLVVSLVGGDFEMNPLVFGKDYAITVMERWLYSVR